MEFTPPPTILRQSKHPNWQSVYRWFSCCICNCCFLLTKSPTPVAQTPLTSTEKQQPIETPSLTPTPEASQLTTSPPPTQPTSAAVGSNNLDTTAALTPKPTLAQDKDYSWLAYKSVTDEDLVGKSAFELDIIRNSIFARHGRQFVNQELQNYFNNEPWYRPIYLPKEFPNTLLSDLERKNAAYILQYQNQNGLRWAR
jgi:serine/threonine-protein kinase